MQGGFKSIIYLGELVEIIFTVSIFIFISFFLNWLAKLLMNCLSIYFIEKWIWWYMIIAFATLYNTACCIWYFRWIWILVFSHCRITTFLCFIYSLFLFLFYLFFHFGRNFWDFYFLFISFYLNYIFILLNMLVFLIIFNHILFV